MENSAVFGNNRYLVPLNGGIATPVCALARNDSKYSTNTNFVGKLGKADKRILESAPMPEPPAFSVYFFNLRIFHTVHTRKEVDTSRIPTAMIPAMAAVCIPWLANSSISPRTA